MRLLRAFRLSVLLLAIGFVVDAQQRPAQTAKGKLWETDSERQFSGRYANCDYGFYVLLPEGYLAHGSHSPSPNHGFLVGLPDTGRTADVSLDDKRFICVNAEYNSFGLSSLKEAADWRTKSSGEGKTGFKVLRRADMKLNGLAAGLIRYQYEGSSGTVFEEEVIALRAGILYEIGLRTNADDYKQDEDQFLKLIGNFRCWRIHNC